MREAGAECKMLIGLKFPGRKLGLKLGKEGNTSCDSFMSNLLLLLINIFTGSISWEEHCPWVRSEFILVNNSWTLLIYFSTGSKTITFVLLWFGKEKPHKITKQAEEMTVVWAFQGGTRKKHGREVSLSPRFLYCALAHTLLNFKIRSKFQIPTAAWQ